MYAIQRIPLAPSSNLSKTSLETNPILEKGTKINNSPHEFPPTSTHPPTLHDRHNRGIVEPEISTNRPRTQRATNTNDTMANVGQMRHLRPVHQCTIHHITISPNLGPFPHHSV